MKNVKNIRIKAWIMYSSIFLVGLAVAVKMFSIQFTSDELWTEKAVKSAVKVRKIEPNRGQIFSSDRLLLATTISEFEIRWDSQAALASFSDDTSLLTNYIDSASISLAEIFGETSAAEYRQKFTKALNQGNEYARIEEEVDYLQKKELSKKPFFKLGRYKSGLIFEEKKERKKPLGKLASRTIGIHRDNEKVGLERAYDSELSGQAGQRLEELIAGGTWKPVNDEYIIEPTEGADVISSIHSEIQDVASTSLEKMLRKHDCEWGVAIVMEVETGYIRAMSNLAKSENKKDKSISYFESKNFSILERTEPGSTFKLPSL